MLRRIDEVVRDMDEYTRKQIEKDLGVTYMAFGKEARKAMRKLGAEIPKEFSSIHTQAIEAAADDAVLKFGNTLTGVKRSAQDFVRLAKQEAIRERIVAGSITGQASEEITKAVAKEIKDQGIVSLIDRGGKKWQLDRYADMLTKQVLANTSRDAVFNNAKEFGFDLVTVTDHSSKHEACAVWEGRTLSLTGATKGYPTLEDAKAAGLFHVGCKHGYTIAG